MTGSRAHLWLPLLQRLTDRHSRWAVWKNVESALHGHGDVDSLAPPREWGLIEQEFRAWAKQHGFGPVIVCRHVPQGPHFLTLQPDSPYLLQLDVKERATFRGSTLLDVDQLQTLARVDDRGIRTIRPGAEGVIKLVSNGTHRGGRPDLEALKKKRVRELLSTDPEGVELAARLFGPAAFALRAGAGAVLRGEWDRSAMRVVEAWALLRSLGEPAVALSRLRFGWFDRRRCPVIQLIRRYDRRVPTDAARWLRQVAQTHTVDW